jgi:hypothetical protein
MLEVTKSATEKIAEYFRKNGVKPLNSEYRIGVR